METEVNEIRRRTWAPFVGAALAVLTSGSLVVFSLVAQRTSLDGFPERASAAPADTADDSPASITIAPVTGGRAGGAMSDPTVEDAQPDATSLIEVAEFVPRTVALVAATEPTGSDADDGDAVAARGDSAEFDGRFRADGILLANRGDGGGGGPSDREWDGQGSKQPHKSRLAKSKKTHGKNKGHKKSKARNGKGQRHASPSRHNASATPSRAGGSQGEGRSSTEPRAQRSSKPSAKPSGAGSPPAHSNAGGKGRSRGRGHKRH